MTSKQGKNKINPNLKCKRKTNKQTMEQWLKTIYIYIYIYMKKGSKTEALHVE